MLLYTSSRFKKFSKNRINFSCWYYKNRRFKQLSTNVRMFGGRTQTGRVCLLSKGNYKTKYIYRVLNYSFKYFSSLSMLVTIQNNSKNRQHVGLFVNNFGCWFYSLFPSSISAFDYYKNYKDNIQITEFKQYSNSWPKHLIEFSQYSKISYIEDNIKKIAVICRAAGSYCLLIKNDYMEKFSIVILPSKKVKLFFGLTRAFGGTIGAYIKNKNFITKAGYFVSRGRKPTVRGTVKNSCDHPNGGRTRALRLSRTPWGKVAKKSRKSEISLKLKSKLKRTLKSKFRFNKYRTSYFDIKDSYYANVLSDNFF